MSASVQSFVHQIESWASKKPDAPAIHDKGPDGHWRTLTWSQYWTAVREVARGLIALGHQPGDCVAIVGANRMEWVLAQFGIIAAKGIPAPGYPSNTIGQVAHILRNSEAKIAIADSGELIANYRKAVATDPENIHLEHLVCMLDGQDDEAMTLDALRAKGREQDDAELDARLAAIGDDDVCMLIYTSGTTGVAKGVTLEHGGILHMQQAILGVAPMLRDAETNPYIIVSYLPLCHVAEQAATNFGSLATGGQVYFCPDIKKIKDYLGEVRPTVFLAVPRVWEKFQAVLEARLGDATGVKARLASWARDTERAAVIQEMTTGRPADSLSRSIANKLVISKVKGALGLDRLCLALTGAAPISLGTLEFFASLGIGVHEVYGMSETTGLLTGNPMGGVRFGTVGRALDGVEVRIAPDGEIIARGRNMTRGYLRMPEKTAELLDEQGWLHTGDLGALDDEGYLRITGRKKDILITAGGKNVAPAEMEAYLNQIPGVGQAVVVGDRQPYLSALIVLDPENLETLAANAGVGVASLEALASDDAVKKHLMARVEADCNANVARYQTIKRIKVIPHEFSVEGGELTPTMKVKRNVVAEKYAADISALYEG
jgi:long-chain acyl-CoA synthetase